MHGCVLLFVAVVLAAARVVARGEARAAAVPDSIIRRAIPVVQNSNLVLLLRFDSRRT